MAQNSAAVEKDGPEPSDAELLDRSRADDPEAFAELWRRHHRSGITVARSVTQRFEADDLVQEAFSRIYHSVRRGGGPTGSFRAYLFTSIRNTAADWGRAPRVDASTDEVAEVADPDAEAHASDATLDRSLTSDAFQALPSRWQEVLWYTEVERLKPADVAPLLGIKPVAVAQLAFRAREGLREAWIQAHLRAIDDNDECHWVVDHLGAYSRGNLSSRDLRRVRNHLPGCTRCSAVASEARQVSGRLAMVLLPVIVGSGAALATLTALREGAGAAVAVAAMPSAVISGSAASGAGGTAGAVGAAHAMTVAGASVAGGAVAGGAAAGTAAAGGVGATVALLAAGAAVVAAVSFTAAQGTERVPGDPVVAVTEMPTAPPPTPVGSPPPSPSPSAVTPTATVSLPAFPTPAASSTPRASDPAQLTVTTPPAPASPDPVRSGTPAPSATPRPTPSAEPTPTPTPTPTPELTPTPTPEPTPTPTPTPDPGPVLPEGTPAVVDAHTVLVRTVTEVRIQLSGAPGATVQALTNGDVRATATLDAAGSGSLVVRPTLLQLLLDVHVDLRYVAGEATGGFLSLRLSDLR
ncbi:sigma-70 family RNA polymerase sigma factor [Microbacterium wangchenii]|nr:sigma-70 family RNA polymerase sigma factor [Microbacterium wangchenii]